jgi:hypothetical protein
MKRKRGGGERRREKKKRKRKRRRRRRRTQVSKLALSCYVTSTPGLCSSSKDTTRAEQMPAPPFWISPPPEP